MILCIRNIILVKSSLGNVLVKHNVHQEIVLVNIMTANFADIQGILDVTNTRASCLCVSFIQLFFLFVCLFHFFFTKNLSQNSSGRSLN